MKEGMNEGRNEGRNECTNECMEESEREWEGTGCDVRTRMYGCVCADTFCNSMQQNLFEVPAEGNAFPTLLCIPLPVLNTDLVSQGCTWSSSFLRL